MIRKILATLSILVCFGCLAVSWTSQTNRAQLLVPYPFRLEELNPQKVVSGEAKAILGLVFSSLFEVRGGRVHPKIVDKWDLDPSEGKYILHLKKNVRFHNGQLLTADDVVFSIEQWMKKESLDSHLLNGIIGFEAYYSKRTKSIEGVNKVDDYAVSIRTKATGPDLIQILAMPRFLIIPKDFGGMDAIRFWRNPIGSGPYRLKVFSADEAEFERNDLYFGEGPQLGSIKVLHRTFKEAINGFNLGKFDNLLFYDLSDVKLIHRNDATVDNLPATSTVALVFALNEARQESIDLRRAVVQELGKIESFRDCYRFAQAADSLFPPGMLLNDQTVEKPKVRAPVSLDAPHTVYFTTDIWDRCFSEGRQERRFTRLSLRTGEMDELFLKFKKGELHTFVEEFFFKNADPMTVLQYFDPSSVEYLLSKKLPKLEEYYTRIKLARDSKIRDRTAHELVDYLKKQYLVVPLYHPLNFRIYSSKLKGVTLDRFQRLSIDWERLGYK